MLYEAASKLHDGMKPSSAVLQALEQEAMTFIIQDANQISEVETLMRAFDKHELSAIMLKGWIMKDLYPRTDLRSRADTDIFIHSQDELKIHEIIMSHGYATNGLGEKKDTVYSKEPFITLEMHKNLFMYEDDWNKIFNEASGSMYIWNRVDQLDGYNHIYKMDVNMYYVYHIAHMVKHLVSGGGGIGVKSILDLWMFRKANEEKMDFAHIDADLQTLGLTQFANTVQMTVFRSLESISSTAALTDTVITLLQIMKRCVMRRSLRESAIFADVLSHRKAQWRSAFR